MKFKTTLLLLCLSLSLAGFGQKKATKYQEFKSTIQQKKLSKEVTLDRTMSFLSGNQMYVSELIDVCSFFASERMKYKICAQAYPNIIDKRNFFEVYDVFDSFAFAIKLYHRTQGRQNNETNTPITTIDYPNPAYYNGIANTRCKQPMPAYRFRNLLASVTNDFSRRSLERLENLVAEQCFSTAQLMKLGNTLRSTNQRYDFFRYAIDFVFDIENYYYAKQLLSNATKRNFSVFVDRKIAEINDHADTIDCRPLSPNEFSYILKAIKDQRFAKDKLRLAKQHIERNCFSIPQIRKIAKLFSFDKQKLEILKFSYQYCPRKEQYFTLKNVLGFSSYQRDFDQFLLDQRY